MRTIPRSPIPGNADAPDAFDAVAAQLRRRLGDPTDANLRPRADRLHRRLLASGGRLLLDAADADVALILDADGRAEVIRPRRDVVEVKLIGGGK